MITLSLVLNLNSMNTFSSVFRLFAITCVYTWNSVSVSTDSGAFLLAGIEAVNS